MKLFLMRHGIAVEFGAPSGERDSERPLTTEGRRKVKQIAKVLADLEAIPDVIFTSPLVRARQTAEIMATVLRRKQRLHINPHLACSGNVRKLIADVNKLHGQAESVMLVGHEPDLSSLASLLLTGNASGAAIEMKKGSLCVLEADALRTGKCAKLLWLAPPKLLF